MKKRLSLLMVVMMLVSMLPMSAFAAVTTESTVTDVRATNQAVAMKVQVKGLTGINVAENVELQLVDKDGKVSGAVFTGAGNAALTSAAVTVKTTNVGPNNANNVTASRAVMTVPADPTATNAEFVFYVNFKDAEEGDVYLRVRNTDGASNSVFNFAPVKVAVVKPYDTSNLATTVDNAEKTVSVKGGALSSFYVSNLSTTPATTHIRLELDGMDWDDAALTGTTVLNQAGQTVAYSAYGRYLVIPVGVNTGFRINPVVKNVDRKASYGDVRVDIEAFNGAVTNTVPSGVKRTATNYATIGKLVEYGVTMTVTEVNKKEIPSLWGGEEAKVKVTLKGPKGSLLNESIDFKVDGAFVRYGDNDTTGDAYFNSTKTATTISGDPHIKYVVADGAKDARYKDNEFRISENGVNFNNETEVSFELTVVAAGTKDGIATITAYQRGLEVTADLLKATPKFTAAADVTPVKKGEARDTATVTLTEAKAGLIQRGEKLRFLFDTKRDYVEFTTDDITIEATNGMKFDTTSSGIKLEKGDNNGEVILTVVVDKVSTGEPAVITVSGLNVAVDGSTTDDVVKLNTGLIERDNTNKHLKAYNVSNIDYIKVVKEYDMESILSVFTIGQTAYTVNGVEKTSHAAPYIKEGRTMLPIRAVAESLGLTVQWNSATRTASFTDANKVAAVTIGSNVIYVNGTPMPLTVPAELTNDTTFVELRSLATAFGVQIDWDSAAKVATVSK